MNDKLKSRPLTAEDLGLSSSKTKPKPQGGNNRPKPITTKSDNNQKSTTPAARNNQQRPSGRSNTQRSNQNRSAGRAGAPARGANIRRGNAPRPRGGGRRPTNFMNGSFNSSTKSAGTAAQKVGMSKIDAGKLKIIPLGGLGQIGKNLMALEYENDIIVMDLGFTFPGEDQPGIDLIVPDVAYLEERKHKIRGHVITHAHEDHVGGVPFVLPKIPAPIYGAKFTIKFIERKLEEYRLDFKPELHIMDPDKHDKVQLGCFNVEFVRITHSIPDACMLIIDTPVGKIVNTGDWRFEPDPVDGKPSDMERIKQLGKENVLMLMCDSTNCEVIGHSPREKDIMHTLDDLFIRNYNKRIIVASFSSQINRMQLVIDAAHKAKRKLVVVGRSMLSNMELAVKLGYIKVPSGLIVKAQDMAKFQQGELIVLSTGSQGEEFSALNRMGKGEHKEVKIQKDDVVILSASIIPGNEKSVWSMVDNLFRWGAYVYQTYTSQFDELGVTHATGHAYSEEIEEMLKLVKPQYYLPIHGEYHHLVHNANIGEQVGVPRERIFVIEDGQTLVADSKGVKLGPKVQSGEILIDGAGIGDVQEIVLKDRIAMSTDGVFTTIVTVSRKDGKLLTSPDIISRGFIYVKDNTELIENARKIVRNVIATKPPNVPVSSPIIKARMRDEVSHYLYKITQRNPIVLPVVIEV
jgi:ribonuclease J